MERPSTPQLLCACCRTDARQRDEARGKEQGMGTLGEKRRLKRARASERGRRGSLPAKLSLQLQLERDFLP